MKKNRQDKFQNFEVDPSPGLWKKIEAELPQKKKRRWLFFWLIGAVILSVAGIKYFTGEKEAPVVSHLENKNQNYQQHETAIETTQVNKSKEKSQSPLFVEEKKHSEKKLTINSNSNKKKRKPVDSSSQSENVYSSPEPVYVAANSQSENFIVPPVTEGLDFLSPITLDLDINSSDADVQYKKLEVRNSRKISRWSIYAGALIAESDYKSFEDTTDEYTENIRGLTSKSFTGGVNFDLNTHLRFSFGITAIEKGQIREGVNTIVLHNDSGNNKTYSISTPFGDITGSGSEFDQTFFNSTDSILFHVFATLGNSASDTVQTKSFSLKEDFSYLEFPLTITYRMSERRITPFGGISLTTSYLKDHSISLNGDVIDYNYESKLRKYNFCAGLVAGFDIRLTSKFSIYLNGFYEKNLTSVTDGEKKWKPSVKGASGGLTYRF